MFAVVLDGWKVLVRGLNFDLAVEVANRFKVAYPDKTVQIIQEET